MYINDVTFPEFSFWKTFFRSSIGSLGAEFFKPKLRANLKAKNDQLGQGADDMMAWDQTSPDTQPILVENGYLFIESISIVIV